MERLKQEAWKLFHVAAGTNLYLTQLLHQTNDIFSSCYVYMQVDKEAAEHKNTPHMQASYTVTLSSIIEPCNYPELKWC